MSRTIEGPLTEDHVQEMLGKRVRFVMQSGQTEGSDCIVRGIDRGSLILEFPPGSNLAGKRVGRQPLLRRIKTLTILEDNHAG